MIIRRLGFIDRNQSGFTIVELLISFAVAALVAIAVVTGVFQIVTGNVRTSNHMTAVRQVQEAGYWVNHDAQMSENISTSKTAANGFPLNLTWREWDGSSEYEVIYNLQDMPFGGLKEFTRQYVIFDSDGYVTDNTTSVIAQHIDGTLTSCNLTIDNLLIFTVKATVGSGSEQASETRVYEVIARPDS